MIDMIITAIKAEISAKKSFKLTGFAPNDVDVLLVIAKSLPSAYVVKDNMVVLPKNGAVNSSLALGSLQLYILGLMTVIKRTLGESTKEIYCSYDLAELGGSLEMRKISLYWYLDFGPKYGRAIYLQCNIMTCHDVIVAKQPDDINDKIEFAISMLYNQPNI